MLGVALGAPWPSGAGASGLRLLFGRAVSRGTALGRSYGRMEREIFRTLRSWRGEKRPAGSKRRSQFLLKTR